jgi:putative ABC transport system permease protein
VLILECGAELIWPGRAVPGGSAVSLAHAGGTAVPSSYVNVFSPAELALLALAGLVIGVVGALLPASWAARARTATALRAE